MIQQHWTPKKDTFRISIRSALLELTALQKCRFDAAIETLRVRADYQFDDSFFCCR